MSRGLRGMKLFRTYGLALAALLAMATPAHAAQSRGQPQIEELGEVLVSGEKPTRKVADLIPWLRRLLGQYSFQGWVDLGGQGNPEDRRNVRGVGLCIGFGVAPGVQCEINVRWPEMKGPNGEEVMGGVSTLDPAMILYGLEPDEIGIRYMQVDNTGLAEGATGTIIGDTATFTTACADVPAGCQRITRITAGSDSKIVDVQVDTELDYRLAMRFRFQMTRVAPIQAPATP
ncbi:MAG TPA: hypothetical protein VH835_04520 [Dongiaceae bacterium]|jgi:hypothetical protein